VESLTGLMKSVLVEEKEEVEVAERGIHLGSKGGRGSKSNRSPERARESSTHM